MNRATTLMAFAKELNAQLLRLREAGHGEKPFKIIRIDSPDDDGEIEVVIKAKEWDCPKAMTYTKEGLWTGLSYWMPGQI